MIENIGVESKTPEPIVELQNFKQQLKSAKANYSFRGRKFTIQNKDCLSFVQLLDQYKALWNRMLAEQGKYSSAINEERINSLLECKKTLLDLNTNSDAAFFGQAPKKLTTRILATWIKFIRIVRFFSSSHRAIHFFDTPRAQIEESSLLSKHHSKVIQNKLDHVNVLLTQHKDDLYEKRQTGTIKGAKFFAKEEINLEMERYRANYFGLTNRETIETKHTENMSQIYNTFENGVKRYLDRDQAKKAFQDIVDGKDASIPKDFNELTNNLFKDKNILP